jgi:hypothetical protein
VRAMYACCGGNGLLPGDGDLACWKMLNRCRAALKWRIFELEGHFTAVKTQTMMPSLRLNLGQTMLRRKREECSAFAFPAVALHINYRQTSDVTLPAT